MLHVQTSQDKEALREGQCSYCWSLLQLAPRRVLAGGPNACLPFGELGFLTAAGFVPGP